ncbi:MAG: hypothetical protein GEV04_18570 [Actinophytocola sp.]|nr:hypothetical protein [Actinophytocola sp.]
MAGADFWTWSLTTSKDLSYDETYHLLRCQPRRPKSNWSASNKERVARLIVAGRLRPAGLAQVEAAKADGRWDA